MAEAQRDGAGGAIAAKNLVSLSIDLLGGFQVRIASRVVQDTAWRLHKARSLLKLLALAPGHRLAREQVMDSLWPDLDPDAALNNLHQTVHAVRRALQAPHTPPVVSLQHGLLQLQPNGSLWVDVDAFESAAAAARRLNTPELYHAALDLYAGDLLPEDIYEDWAAWRREALRETQLGLLSEVARRHEARGELKQAMDAFRRAVEAEPSHEEAHMELVRLYASTGQRGRALRQYALLRDTLSAELDSEPDVKSQELHAAVRAGHFAESDSPTDDVSLGMAKHNLPIPLTSFVGREGDIAELKQLLAGARLLTLTGVGGAGKTRLALQAGWDLLTFYRDGVWMANLASLVDPDLVPKAVARIWDLPEQAERSLTEALIEKLRSCHALLILDNCEHLLTSCSRLAAALLSACTDLQILATSREPLGVAGEVTRVTRPLAVPDASNASEVDLLRFDAVRLFVERARYRQLAFALTADTAPDVIRVCQQVDGIPLAIELAAARVGTLALADVATRLANAPGFLTTGERGRETRHQTLRAALDWSYRLLDESEQLMFRRLSVFEGGWLLESAEAISVDDPHNDTSPLDLLSRLVDKSLVMAEGVTDGTVYYRMLEPVRQYGRERLVATGEERVTRRRHAYIQLELAETAEPELTGPSQRRWLERLELDRHNLRAALSWSLDEGDLEVGLRIAGAIWRFWFTRGYLTEGRAVVARLLTQPEDAPPLSFAVRAKALNAAGALAYYQSDGAQATGYYEASLALRREIGDERGVAGSLGNLGLVLKERGDFQQAARLYEESRELYSRLGDRRGIANALNNLGIIAQDQGEYQRANALHEESLALKRELQDGRGIVTSLNNLGAIAVDQGEYLRANELLQESLRLTMELGAKRSRVVALINLGHMEREQGRRAEAEARYRESLALAQELGEPTTIAMSLKGLATIQDC